MSYLGFRAKRVSTVAVCLFSLLVLSGAILIKGTTRPSPTGTWAPAGNGSALASPRAGAVAVQLQDGRILITGGDNGSGPVASADIYDTSGNFAPATPMNVARSRHTATLLQDGTVLVAGGIGTGDSASNSAEIYNPSTDTWTATASSLISARSGHTATALPDGTVLLAGGDNSGAPLSSLEIYDPATGMFSAVAGSLSSPRDLHAAAALPNGDVIIAGGSNGSAALATTDIYSFSSGAVSPGPAMSTPRQALSATAQLDGDVLVAGGNNGSTNGSQDLASAEVYSATAGTFTPTGNLTTARQGHQAFLLPHSGAILIVDGTATVSGTETTVASAELYYPLATGQDASPNWNGTFNATGSMASPRVSATGSPLSIGTPQSQNDGILLVAGGKDASGSALSSAELYGFAWVKTDAADYAPGTTVNITGGGWQPGETVTLHFQESPYYDSHPDLTAVADSNGNISNSQFAPDSHDVNIRFYLTATGSASGSLAQTTFTDSKPNTVAVGAQSPASITPGNSATYTVTVGFNGNGTACTANLSVSGLPTGASSGGFSPASVNNTGNGQSTLTVDTTSSVSTSGSPYTFTVTATPATGSCQSGSTAVSSNGTLTVGPGSVSASTSTVVAVPTSVVADGSTTSTITVTLEDANGNLVSGKNVALSAGSGSSTITTVNGTTNPSGQATFTVKDTKVESVTYTAKDTSDNLTVSQTAAVSFTVGTVSASKSTVSANPTSVTADGTTTSTITVTLLDANSNPVTGKTVSLTAGSGSSTISAPSGSSNASGVVTFTVKDTKAEAVTYTAKDTNDGTTITQTATVTFTAGAVSAGTSTVSANPTSVIANGTATSTITVTLLDANSNPVSGKTVSLTAGSGSSTISAASGASNASGVVIFTVKDTKVESVTYTAKDTSDSTTITQTAQVTFTVGPVSATTSTVTANPTSVTADGTTTSTITVTLLDAGSNPVSGKTVTLTAGSGSSTISAASGASNASGAVMFTVKDTKAEAVTYTAKDTSDNITITQTAQVTFKAGAAAKLAFSQQPSTTTAGSVITPAVTVSVEDANGNVVTTDSSTVAIAISTPGAFSGTSTLSAVASSGVASFSNLIPTASGNYTLSATDGSLTAATSNGFTVNAGALAKFVFATITSPQTAGTAFNVTITAEDANGNTVTSFSADGNNVVLTSTGTLAGAPITTPAFTNGVLNESVTITNTGSFTITATGNAGHGGGTGTSNEFTVNPGPAATLTVAGYPSPVTAGAPNNFTVTAKDSNGNTATGYTGTVKFASSDAQAALPTSSTLTNGTGTFSATLKTAGTQSITATDTVTSTITGTQSGITVNAASASSVTPTAGTAQSATINTAFAIPLQATVKDAFNNPVSGVTVTFMPPGSGPSGAFAGTNTATTNASGVATANTFTANGIAGSYMVTASAAGATSASFSLTNNQASTATSVSVSPSSITIGASTTVTATVTPQHTTGAPGGTVSVSDGLGGTGDTCTITLSGGTGQCNLTPSSSGSLTVTGTYNGDGNFTMSSGTAGLSVTGTPPLITSANSTSFTAGAAGTFPVSASGLPAPALSESTGTGQTGLPNGVTFTDNGGGTGTLAGTAAVAGTYTFTISAQNVVGTVTRPFTLTVTAGGFTQLQILVPGETAAPGTTTGYTGSPNIEYVNGQFPVTVNAVDANWNVVSSVTDTLHIASNDAQAILPATDAALVAGTGTFNVTPETVSYNPAKTTFTATDTTDTTIAAVTTPAIEVITAYTAAITPKMAATGQPTTYTLTISNAAAPNTNNLESATVAVPTADQGTAITGVSVSATTQPGSVAVNWTYDASQLPGTMRFSANTGTDAVAPGGTITITFTATSSAPVTSSPIQEVWNTVAFSDSKWTTPLPLALPEPTVSVGVGPSFTSGASTAFTYGSSGTFTVKTNGVPTNKLTESRAPAWVTFTDNGDDTATISGTPTAAGNYPITITASNGFGPDATQNFTLMVSGAALTITASSGSMTYGGPVFPVTPGFSGFVNGDTYKSLATQPTCSTTATSFSAVAGSPYVTSCSGAVDSNYTITYASGTVTITPAALNISADNQSMTFGGANPSFTASYSGFQGSDNSAVVSGLTFTVYTDSTMSTAVTDFQTLKAGSYPIVASGGSAANYNISYGNGTLTVNKATFTGLVTISPADPNTVPYGQPVTATVLLNSYSIGGVPVLQTHADPNNPNQQLPESLTVYLVPAGQGPSQAMKFGTATAVPAYDNTANTTGTTKTGWTATITGNAPTPGNYTAFAYGDDPGNNSLTNLKLADAGYFYADTADIIYPTLQSKQLDVVQAALTITANDASKTYGQTVTFAGTEFSPTGLVSGDTVTSVTLTSAGAAATATVAGSPYPIVPSAAVGSGLNNYSITYVNGKLTVKQAMVTPSITASNKVYDGTTTATVACTLLGVVNSDSVSCSAASANFSQANASNGLTVTATGIILSGPAAPNYSLASTTATTTANITPAPTATTVISNPNPSVYGQTVTFTAFVNNTGSHAVPTGTVSFSIDGTPVGGTLETCPSAIPANRLCATYSTSALTVSGSPHMVSANYTNGDGNFQSGTGPLTGGQTVNPAPLTITASSGTTTYGQTPVVVMASYMGFVNQETSSNLTTLPTCAPLLTITSAPGTYPSSCSGAVDPNYSISYVGGTVTISQATTVTTLSLSSPTINYGDSTTVTAKVSPQYAGTPTGTVSVSDGIGTAAGDSCSITLSGGTGTCTLTPSAVASSGSTVTGTYSGDADFLGSPATTSLTVNPATTSTTVTSTTNPSILGQAVAFTAAVTDTSSDDPAVPTGTVLFYDGTTLIGSAALASGNATFTTALLSSSGAHSITASFLGNADFSASTSSAQSQTVNPRSTSTTASVSPTTVVVGQLSTVTLSVADTATTGPSGAPGVFVAATNMLNTGRTGQAAALLPNGTVLVAGGEDSGGNVLASGETYDPTAGKFTVMPNSLTQGVTGATATLLPDGTVLFAGGSTDGTASGATGVAEIFDPIAQTFTQLSSALATPRYGATATLLATGKVLIAGGENGSGTLNSMEIYDPVAQTFNAIGDILAVAREGATATRLYSGQILFTGGSGLSSAEIYDPAAHTSTLLTNSMTVDRTNHAAVLQPDGNVLIAGGTSSGNAVATVELYNTAAQTFTAAAHNLIAARSGLTATMLDSAQVIVIGGSNSGAPALASSELDTPSFDPLGTVAVSSSDNADGISSSPCTLALTGTGISTCQVTDASTEVGTSPHTLTATYAAASDQVHTSSDNTGQTDGKNQLTVNKADTLTTVTSSPAPSIYGGQVTFSAAVSVVTPGTGSPTGAVQFVVDGANYGSPVSLSGETASIADAALTAGSHSVTAIYSGDGNFNKTGFDPASTASTATQVVQKATPTFSNLSSRTIAYGVNSVTLTGTVSASCGAGCTVDPPSGETVSVTIGGVSGSGVIGASGAFSVTVTGTGALAVSTSPYTVTYSYNSTNTDTNFTSATDSSTKLTVNSASTATTVVSNPNPSIYGQMVTFTAFVTNTAPASPAVPTGAVTFTIDGTPNQGTTTLCPSAIPANRLCAKFSTSALTVTGSPHVVSATYTNSDGDFAVGSGTLASGQTVNPAPLTITASSGSMVYGGPVFPVTASPMGLVNGDSATSLGASLTCSTTATSSSPVGGYPSSCSGAVDGNYTISYVNGIVTVIQATSTTMVTSSSTNNTSVYLQPVTFTATVSPQYTGTTPTGTVYFYDAVAGETCANAVASYTSTQIGSLALSFNSGVDSASISTGSLAGSATPHNILACYSGDTNFVSSSGAVSQTVTPAPVVTISPGNLTISFTGQNVGTTSSPVSITVTNIGDAPLELTNPTIPSSTDSSDFAIQANTCGATLGYQGESGNPPTSCTVSVTFTPKDTGEVSATLQITDNNDNVSGSQQTVILTGGGLSTIKAIGSLYSGAVFATANTCGSLTLSGGSTIDSFNSAQGFSSSHALSGGNVATNGNVTVNGNAVIYGTAATDYSTTGTCKGSVTGLTTSGKASVTGGLVPLNGPITYPLPPTPNPAPPTTTANISHSCPSGMTGCTSTGSNNITLAPGSYGNVQVSGGTTMNVTTGTYNFNSLTLTGNSVLRVSSAPAIINIVGAGLSGSNPAFDLSGGSIANPTGIPSNLQFFYAGSRGVNLSGGAQAYATVYAPMAPINMSGGTDFFGGIVGLTVTDSGGTAIHYDRNLTNVAAGGYIWLTALVNNVKGLSSSQAKLYLTSSTVSFTAGGTPYSVQVPNAVVTFNSTSASSSKTSYDMTNNRWITSVPSAALTGNTFVAGVAIPVAAGGFPGGIQNISWSTAFSTDTPNITFQWQWSAGTYTSFNPCYAYQSTNSGGACYNATSNSNVLNVNPEDGSADLYGTDPAGTPEAYKQNEVIGFFSAPAGVAAAAAEMSTAPSNFAFTVPQTKTTSSASALVSVLTNNDGVSHVINGFSMAGVNGADFTLQAGVNSCLGMTSLAAGTSCELYVVFKPSTAAAESARIVINDDANNNPQTVYLSGTGQ